jgi:hypothetical protein
MLFHQQSVYERLFKSDDFKVFPPSERAEFLRLEEEAYRLRLERRLRLREQTQVHKAHMRELREASRLRSRESRVKTVEVYFRTGLTLLLVAVLAVAILVGIVEGVPAGNLTQYLTPISGLAGIAIGYFFGRGSESRQANSPRELTEPAGTEGDADAEAVQ